MTDRARALDDFAALVAGPETSFQLDRAALVIASSVYPDLDIHHYLSKLDALAERVRSPLHHDAGENETRERLLRVLAEEEGFRGNTSHYYDPANSCLNVVLDDKLGIPISLSIVYMEVGRRIGLVIEGVGFPGHFLVRHGEVLLDPFDSGRVLERAELETRLEALPWAPTFSPELVAPASKREILFRMLANLKAIYSNVGDASRALCAVDRMLLLSPESPNELRDRGVLLAHLDRPLEALGSLLRYRAVAPEAADGVEVERLAANLRTRIGFSN